MATSSDIANLMAMFRATYPNYNPKDFGETARVLLMTLSDLPWETLQSATLMLITEPKREFAPGVGEIRGAALKLNAIASGIPDALTAYSEVVAMPAGMTKSAVVFEDGMNIIEYRKLSWSHPFVGRVAEMIGWPKLFPTGEPGVDRAQWVKFYDQELTRQMSESGRLPAVQAYIDERKGKTSGTMPALGDLSNLLEVK